MLQFKVFIYHVFAQEFTCYFVGVYIIIKIIYFFLCVVYYFFRDATGMVLHRDSKWYQQWQEFKDNNPVVTGKDNYSIYNLTLFLCTCNDHDRQKAVLQKNFCNLFTSHIKQEMRCFHFEVIQ